MKLSFVVIPYSLCWFLISWWMDPALPYDAVEAMNWGMNGQWGSPKNPWLPGAVMLPVVHFHQIPVNLYWYGVHFLAAGVGLTGVWYLALSLTRDRNLAWFAMLSLGVSGVTSIDLIPYNDNYLLVMLWPWMFWCLIRALTDSPWWWLPFSVVAGLATMAKYSTLAFIFFILLIPFFRPSLCQRYTHPAFWCGLLTGTVMVLPNLLWLAEHDFSAFRWVGSQIEPGINAHIVVSLLSVFYPVLVAVWFLRKQGLRMRWPAEDVPAALLVVFCAPLILISVWFLFSDGGRLTEWLQPFSILSAALLPALFRTCEPVTHLTRYYRFYGVCAGLVLLGYALVMGLNIRQAGTKFSGIQMFSQEIEQEWQRRFGTPLHYVGGGYLSRWLIVYSPSRPQVMTPWRSDTMPGIYNARITFPRLKQSGGIVIGEAGQRCEDEHFVQTRQTWPALGTIAKAQLYFRPEPSSQRLPVCVGFIAPGA